MRAGLQQARLHAPDLILLDLMLPLIDGLEVCRRLRADDVARNTLILMLTAKTEETDEIVGLAVVSRRLMWPSRSASRC